MTVLYKIVEATD